MNIYEKEDPVKEVKFNLLSEDEINANYEESDRKWL